MRSNSTKGSFQFCRQGYEIAKACPSARKITMILSYTPPILFGRRRDARTHASIPTSEEWWRGERKSSRNEAPLADE
jgi:hypothetical protein